MKSLLEKFITIPFNRALNQYPWLGPVLSAVLVAMLINVLTETLVELGGARLGWIFIGTLIVFTIIVVYINNANETKRRRNIGSVKDLPQPDKQPGLIFAFSNEATLREAIEYHLPILKYCWLLVTPEMQEEALKFINQFKNVSITTVPISDRYNTQACYLAVHNIFHTDAPRLGLLPQQIVGDVTGGTKPMTVGMVLACIEGNYPIEHVPTQFDESKRPIGPLPPIEIRIQSN